MHHLQLYKNCTLCPRLCHVNRLAKETGYCHMTDELMVARAALHMWEEPCISGTNGSGAVFFSGCNMGCVFCQNHEIAHGLSGKSISIERLSKIFIELQQQGAHNINLVTPDHFIPSILPALTLAREKGLSLPIICNCSGYMRPELIELLKDVIDIWLPDFKYICSKTADRYSFASDYPDVAKNALALMVKYAGEAQFDHTGMITKGVIVRHLILPGHEEDSRTILKYLYHEYGHQIYISIMNQFTPTKALLPDYPELNHTIDEETYNQIVDEAIETGIENGFIQEGETALESFIPPFNYEGV